MERFQEIVQLVFGGDVPQEPLTLSQIATRAVFVYLSGIFVVRIGKSRLIGRVTSLDILLGFILGSLLSRGITGHASLSGTFIASLTLVAIHWICTALAYRSHLFGNLVKGRSYILVDQGKLRHDNLKRAHISIDDLMEELRLHGITHIENVQLATKERNGEISVITK